MAIVGIAKQIPDGRSGEELEAGLKRFMRTYFVETDDALDGPLTVLTAPGLPSKGEAYSGHPTAVVVGRYPRPLPNTRLHWHVEIEYSTHSVDRDENPLLTRPEIEFDVEPFEMPLPGYAKPGANIGVGLGSDPNGDPVTIEAQQLEGKWGGGILNSAGDPFDPPATVPNFHPVIRYTRNESETVFSAQRVLQYANTVNAGTWNNLLARQAWLKTIQASHEVHLPDGIDAPEILYWRVRYTFVLKAETWDLALLNIGPNYLDRANTSTTPYPKKIPFLKDGVRVMDLLKKDGTKYSSTEAKKPTWRVFRVLREVDFSGLDINLSLALNGLRRRRG